MTRSTVRSTTESFTCDATAGNGALSTKKDPMKPRCTITTATTFTAAPPSEISAIMAGRTGQSGSATATPIPDAISMQRTAIPKTTRDGDECTLPRSRSTARHGKRQARSSSSTATPITETRRWARGIADDGSPAGSNGHGERCDQREQDPGRAGHRAQHQSAIGTANTCRTAAQREDCHLTMRRARDLKVPRGTASLRGSSRRRPLLLDVGRLESHGCSKPPIASTRSSSTSP